MTTFQIVIILIVLSALLFVGAVIVRKRSNNISTLTSNIAMKITSPVFEHNQNIPTRYTCDGDNVNPPLMISEVPGGAKSLVLIVDDPDAPAGTWTHWTVWNINPSTKEIWRNSVPGGATEGTTGFGNTGYGGPCPPSGVHRYFFKIYALDVMLSIPSDSNASALAIEMKDHILAHGELVGLYSRGSQ